MVVAAAPAPAFAASPATLTFTVTKINTDDVRVTVTGGRNGLTLRISNFGLLSYTGIENVTKTFAGGSVTFDQTGGTGLFISGYSYTITFTYDGTSSSVAVPGGGSTSKSV